MKSDVRIRTNEANGPLSLTMPMMLFRWVSKFVQSSNETTPASAKRLEKQIKDFASGGVALIPQRQGIYLGAMLLCSFFFNFQTAISCYLFCQVADGLDSLVSLRVMRWSGGSARQSQKYYFQLLGTSTLSATAVATFVLLVANLEGTSSHMTSLFFLFAAGLFAAVNNHQLPKVLAVRLVIYSAVFLFIPIRDIWILNPPLKSVYYMHLATVLFVLYFVLECSMIFLRLYQKGLDQYEELRIERDRAKEVYELKSQFVSVVSHELRTPLTSIIGALGLMKTIDGAKNPTGFAKILEIADKNSKRLSNLINDLLDLQKLESDSMNYQMAPLDPAEIVGDSVHAISVHAEGVGVDVHLAHVDQGLCVDADQDRLTQVLDNLLSNAVKFSDAGTSIEVSLQAKANTAVIAVKDTGIGIPENSHDLVFGKFSQVDSSDHRAHEGTGLGLSIVQQIVEAHSGQIHYESELGEGTTFFVTLPLQAK
ncbi:sensor histidine kinase [Shimia gijangensis]|nr:HAMP domain-containing sensor histidine kinase [Shimia gijangensis]